MEPNKPLSTALEDPETLHQFIRSLAARGMTPGDISNALWALRIVAPDGRAIWSVKAVKALLQVPDEYVLLFQK